VISGQREARVRRGHNQIAIGDQLRAPPIAGPFTTTGRAESLQPSRYTRRETRRASRTPLGSVLADIHATRKYFSIGVEDDQLYRPFSVSDPMRPPVPAA